MARVDIDQASLIEAVLKHLRTQLSLSAQRCYEVIDLLSPGIVPGGDWFLCVAVGAGTFDGELFDGGGVAQLTEYSSLSVGIYVRLVTDQSGKDHDLIRKADRGLIPLKGRVLTALTAHDVKSGSDEFFRNLPMPTSASAPMLLTPDKDDTGAIPLGFLQLTFNCDFDWDLSDDTDDEE